MAPRGRAHAAPSTKRPSRLAASIGGARLDGPAAAVGSSPRISPGVRCGGRLLHYFAAKTRRPRRGTACGPCVAVPHHITLPARRPWPRLAGPVGYAQQARRASEERSALGHADRPAQEATRAAPVPVHHRGAVPAAVGHDRGRLRLRGLDLPDVRRPARPAGGLSGAWQCRDPCCHRQRAPRCGRTVPVPVPACSLPPTAAVPRSRGRDGHAWTARPRMACGQPGGAPSRRRGGGAGRGRRRRRRAGTGPPGGHLQRAAPGVRQHRGADGQHRPDRVGAGGLLGQPRLPPHRSAGAGRTGAGACPRPTGASAMTTSRRDFIRNSAIASAALAAGLPLPAQVADAVVEGEGQLKWSKAPCRYCGTGCGINVAVHNGRVVATHGDVHAEVNRGLNCVKGYFLSKVLYGVDRVTTPRLRKTNGVYGKNGDFTPVSWEEAFDVMEEKFRAVLKAKGGDGIGMFGSGQWTVWEGYAANKLMKAGFRSNHIDPNARHCMASAVTGFMRTFGMDEPMGCYDDIEAADAFVLWGSNMAEMHPILWTRVTDRRLSSPHVKVAVLSTFEHRSFDLADIPMVFKPQTDLVILNYIANHIIQSGNVNRDFVDRHTTFKRGNDDIGY